MGEHGAPEMGKHGVPEMNEHGVPEMGEHGALLRTSTRDFWRQDAKSRKYNGTQYTYWNFRKKVSMDLAGAQRNKKGSLWISGSNDTWFVKRWWMLCLEAHLEKKII